MRCFGAVQECAETVRLCCAVFSLGWTLGPRLPPERRPRGTGGHQFTDPIWTCSVESQAPWGVI